jgi:hypothetical protein
LTTTVLTLTIAGLAADSSLAGTEEVADLLAIADRDLAACNSSNLHNDWRFNIAYNAALQLATAALAIHGYQAERASHHFRVIDSLPHTLGTDSGTVKKFDTCRKKRNISDYNEQTPFPMRKPPT